MMKKVDMIKTIQLAEARAWLAFKESRAWLAFQVTSGKDNPVTQELKEKWMTLKCLMGSLDIDSDVELAESKAALQLILDNYKSTMY
jgi:hypothetical protein